MEQNAAPQITTSEICDKLGRKAMSDRLDVGITQISNACVENRFSARWYLIVRSMCDEAGIPCPETLFTFVEAKAS